MFRHLFCIAIYLFVFAGTQGQNLVFNGSFDEENICAEYKQPCSPVGWKSTSYIVLGYYRQFVKAYSGDHFLPLIVENKIDKNFRTYWQTRLLCPLQKGQRYIIRFYAGCWGGHFIASNLGICFPTSYINQPENKILPLKPDLPFKQENVSGVKNSPWQKVETIYEARGGEQFLLLGNFWADEEMSRHEPYSRSIITYCLDDLSIEPEQGGTACSDSSEVIAALRADIYRHSENPTKIPKKDTSKPIILPPWAIDTIVLPDILFAFDSSRILPGYANSIDSIARRVIQAGYDSIEVNGHTDDKGPEPYNRELSLRRAETVAGILLRNGIDPAKIITRGLGESQPRVPNTNDRNRSLNRRVEIIIHRK